MTESAKNVFLKPNHTTVVMSCHNTKAADGPPQAAETTASQQKEGVIDRTSDKVVSRSPTTLRINPRQQTHTDPQDMKARQHPSRFKPSSLPNLVNETSEEPLTQHAHPLLARRLFRLHPLPLETSENVLERPRDDLGEHHVAQHAAGAYIHTTTKRTGQRRAPPASEGRGHRDSAPWHQNICC